MLIQFGSEVMKKISILSLLLIFIPQKSEAQNSQSSYDGYYAKVFGLYDVGFFFPEPGASIPVRETNSFLSYGVEGGVYKGSFSVGVSVAHGNEFQEGEKEPRLNEVDHTSYWRISGTLRKRFFGTKTSSKVRFHLGGSTGGGYLLYKADEGTGETRFNPNTGRDEYLTRKRNISAAFAEAGIYFEIGVKTNSNTSIILNYHLIDATLSTESFGFNLAKTGIIVQF